MEARDKPMLVLDGAGQDTIEGRDDAEEELDSSDAWWCPEPLQNQPQLFANTSNLLTKTINDEDQKIEMMMLPLMMTMKRSKIKRRMKRKVM